MPRPTLTRRVRISTVLTRGCAQTYCTLGEMTDVLSETWGIYTELLAV